MSEDGNAEDGRAKTRRLDAAAARALAEAAARRAQADSTGAPPRPVELGGRDGPEPTRYGDWERNGVISDF